MGLSDAFGFTSENVTERPRPREGSVKFCYIHWGPRLLTSHLSHKHRSGLLDVENFSDRLGFQHPLVLMVSFPLSNMSYFQQGINEPMFSAKGIVL